MQTKAARLTSRPGLEVRRRERGGYALTAMDLTDPHRAAELQRPVGKYITMELGPYLHRQRDFFARGAGCIARELAALHGGKLFCRDTPGGGSTFVLELPLPRHF